MKKLTVTITILGIALLLLYWVPRIHWHVPADMIEEENTRFSSKTKMSSATISQKEERVAALTAEITEASERRGNLMDVFLWLDFMQRFVGADSISVR